MSERGEIRLVQGNEACAEAALAAGVRFFAGYPITPSSEIAEIMAVRLPQLGGKFIQMEDEIASMAATIGASLAGVKAMTATSGPGFSLKQENIGYAALAEIPCVVVNVQRIGPSTGMPTSPSQGDVMQSRWGTHGDHPVVVFCPWSVREVYDLTVHSVNVAERLRMPVILLMDEVVAHMREKIEIPPQVETVDRPRPSGDRQDYLPYDDSSDVPPMAAFGDGYRFHVTGLYHGPSGFPTTDPEVADRLIRRLCGKVQRRRQQLALTSAHLVDDAEVLVVAYGAAARSALRAVREARSEGVRAGLLKISTIWPFPQEVLLSLAARVRRVVVVEMNLGQLVLEVERVLKGRAPVQHVGRVDGELVTPEEIRAALEGV